MGGHSPTIHDRSSLFSTPLTVDDKLNLEDQKNRTVSGVVPGKMFMRHWIAGEQSTISVANRAVSLSLSFMIILAAGFYWERGTSVVNWTTVASLVFVGGFLAAHTHMMIIIPIVAVLFVLTWLVK